VNIEALKKVNTWLGGRLKLENFTHYYCRNGSKQGTGEWV